MLNRKALSLAAIGALAASASSGVGFPRSAQATGRNPLPWQIAREASRRNSPEIRHHNEDVSRANPHRKGHGASRQFAVRQKASAAQQPKFPEVRARKQHQHPLRDERGAYTLIGGVYHLEGIAPSANEHVISGGSDGDLKFYTVRRKWVGGISEQRGA